MTCACGKPLGRRNNTGQCRSCGARARLVEFRSDPDYIARVKAGVARHFSDPANRAKRVEHLKGREDRMTEEEKQRRREWGQHLHRTYLMRPDILARRTSPESYARMGAKGTERALAWCPVDRRAEYMRLVTMRHFPAVEARAIIEADIRADVLRSQADMRERDRREREQRY